jgi:EAL and modified HD-GYP domain-containing signal transduction protein
VRQSIDSSGERSGIALVARQPIYGRSVNLFAYELLYRHDLVEQAVFTNGDRATAEVVLNTFLDMGLEQLVGNSLAFLNITRTFILEDYCTALPTHRIVLEILEDVEPDEAVIRSLKELSAAGYALALDDFRYSEQKRPLLELADYVKLDFRMFTPEEIAQQVPLLKQFKASLLAEKVETHEEFEVARKLGFDYFQGFFFCQPKLMKTVQVPLNRLSTLRLIVKLQDPEIGIRELVDIIKQDVGVSFKLLRYVNSASLSLPQRIQSISHAVQMVGTHKIRIWASLIMLASVEDKPRELIITAVVRGTMAERLAIAMEFSNPGSSFIVGLFSVLDAMLDLPMPQALHLLQLSEDVHEAILYRAGPMGPILNSILAYERAHWNEVQCGGLNLQTISKCYVDSVSFSRELITGKR